MQCNGFPMRLKKLFTVSGPAVIRIYFPCLCIINKMFFQSGDFSQAFFCSFYLAVQGIKLSGKLSCSFLKLFCTLDSLALLKKSKFEPSVSDCKQSPTADSRLLLPGSFHQYPPVDSDVSSCHPAVFPCSVPYIPFSQKSAHKYLLPYILLPKSEGRIKRFCPSP